MQGYKKSMEMLANIPPIDTSAFFPRIELASLQHYAKTNEISAEEQLKAIFPEQRQEDKTVKRAKEILGELASEFTEDEIRTIATEVEYLCESWLDRYEQMIFDGKTLNELLNIG